MLHRLSEQCDTLNGSWEIKCHETCLSNILLSKKKKTFVLKWMKQWTDAEPEGNVQPYMLYEILWFCISFFN